jgi:hypothetical protein
MGVNESVIELETKINKRRHTIEALNSVKDEIDEQLETERSLLLNARIELVKTYADDEQVANQIVDLDPESPIDLVELLSEIVGRDPPVIVVKELLFDYDFDESDLLELRRSDDVEVINISSNDALKVESFRMPDT